jgi:serine/threonine-protein kinase
MKTCPKCRAIYPDKFAICPQDATPLTDAGGWSEGSVVRGKYRILSKVGQGGMGAVYKALHLKFDQVRALKVMSKDLAADQDFVKRFEREAILMSKLQHANVVRVDDIDETEDGRPYIVMEFVEGRSLRNVIQDEGPLPPLRVCSIARQAAAGLGAAHLLGMVHRDVKPDNIVLLQSPEGERAKVLDFGIAKLKETQWKDGLHTVTGAIIGTPQYLSPEQALGKRSDELDGRSDLYSLGLVMYQMLTQQLPYQADSTVGWMMAHVQVAPAPIRDARPDLDIPDALIDLVMRCLEKDRELRSSNAEVLIRGIERAEEEIRRPRNKAASTEPVAPTPAPSVTLPRPPVAPRTAPRAISTAPWARGWRFWAGLAVIVLIPLILGPLYDRTPTADPILGFPIAPAALVAGVGSAGWWLATRRHWAFRAASLLPLCLFAVVVGVRAYMIYRYMPPWGPTQTAHKQVPDYVPQTVDQLKQANLPPLKALAANRIGDPADPTFVLNFENVSTDARVTDWKDEIVEFDAAGKVLQTISPKNMEPIVIGPGETKQPLLTGHLEKVDTMKVILEKVEYQLLTPDGKVKGSGVWENPHLQEDLAKAQQP